MNRVRPLLQPLARAVGVTARLGPLLPSVRKNAAKDRARVVALRPSLALVQAPVSVGARLRNDPLADRNGPLLPRRLDDLHRAGLAAVPPGVVRVAVGIGARKHAVISRRERLADMDVLASAAVVLTVGAP